MNTLARWAIYALLVAGIVFVVNGTAKHYYQKPLLDKIEKLTEAQKANNKKASEDLAAAKSKQKTVYINRIKTIEKYAETLPKNNACLADADFVRMHRNSD